MRKLIITALSILFAIHGFSQSTGFVFFGTTVLIADSTYAAKVIQQPDEYMKGYSSFDMHARFKDKEEHTVQEYLSLAAKQVRNWSADEQEVIQAGFKEIEDQLDKHELNFALPDTIVFIQSTTAEEFGAGGYTRRNLIVINEREPATLSLIAHELFHVISRANPKLRDRLYANIGFKKCNTIDVRNAMEGLNITNPDCPVLSHYITIDGEDLLLVLHSKKPYDGGNVFGPDYINIGLLAVAGDDDNKKPVVKDGKAVLYQLQDKLELFEQVGTNTDYVLHPEEICAEHFVALVTNKTVPEPKYVALMKEDMQ